MANGPKVYVIKTPKSSPPRDSYPLPDDHETPARKNRTGSAAKTRTVKRVDPGECRKALALAYLAGPITLSRWLKGRSSMIWSSLGFATVLTSITILMLHSKFDSWVEISSFGLIWWLLIAPSLAFLTGVVWARAVAAAGREYPVPYSQLPRSLRSPASVAIAGMVIPGLGLTLTGRYRLAGWAFLLVAPMSAAIVIFSRWQWLWDRSRTPVPAGISSHSLEILFIATVAVASATAILWLVQALDGARRVSNSRSIIMADTASLALLASLAVFAVAFRPVKVANNFHATAVALRSDGYRLIPLGLNEAAARLDPATPTYAAETVELYRAMGMNDKAREKREFLEAKANEYVRLGFGGDNTAVARDTSLPSPYLGNQRSPYNRLQRLAPESAAH